MTVPTYVGINSDGQSSNNDKSLVVSAPAGTGGQLIAFAGCIDARTITSPSGWTQILNDSDGGERVYCWVRNDDAQSTYTYTVSGNFNSAVACVIRITGGDITDYVISTSSGANDTTQTCPTITPSAADSIIFWWLYNAADFAGAAGAGSSADKGTEILDVDSNGGTGWAMSGYYSSAGATSTTGAVITTTGTFSTKRVISLSVAPSAGGGTVVPIFSQYYAKMRA